MEAVTLSELERRACELRQDVLYMANAAQGAPHPGGALSIADIMAALYFGSMRLRADPHWQDRDRLVLSKGHAAPILYAALCRRGYFSGDWYAGLRGLGSKLQGHPDMRKTPGVDMTTGSLGNGLSLGAGMAMGLKMDGSPATVFVVLGDGEMQEGLVWEAMLYSANAALDNLVAIVDCNGYQSCGRTDDISSLAPLEDKFRAFGWDVERIDGHDMKQIVQALQDSMVRRGRPRAIVADTVKGKGVSFMEGDNAWHQKRLGDKQYRTAVAGLTC